MGQTQSKGELLYQQVVYGNTEGIKSLHQQGASLEWIDREGRTPLIMASMNPELFNVAKALLELGANVNSYRPGRQGGTPLHHAAKRGLENNVKLLLSNGANALAMNDDCQTPLDVARTKGHSNVVRIIESHICLFSGWLREFYGPGFLEVLAPQLVSRKIWAVILPCSSLNPTKPLKLELALYSSLQEAQPRSVIALWKANLDDSKLHQSDPSVMIIDNATKTRLKFGPANENDKQQLQWFCDACKGIPQAMHPAFMQNQSPLSLLATAPPAAEDLDMALSASSQSTWQVRPPLVDPNQSSVASSSTNWVNSGSGQSTALPDVHPNTSGSQSVPEGAAGSDGKQIDQIHNHVTGLQSTNAPTLIPSAPPIAEDIVEDGPIHYPSIDSSPIDMSHTNVENTPKGEEVKTAGSGSSCVICLDALAEGACVPCGHVAGCMSCLNEIKAKKWGCPVCRANIDHVIKLYHV